MENKEFNIVPFIFQFNLNTEYFWRQASLKNSHLLFDIQLLYENAAFTKHHNEVRIQAPVEYPGTQSSVLTWVVGTEVITSASKCLHEQKAGISCTQVLNLHIPIWEAGVLTVGKMLTPTLKD